MTLSWAYIDSNGTSSAGGPHKSVQYRTYDVFSGSSDFTLTTGSSGGSGTVLALKGKLSGSYGLNVGGLIDFSSNVATSGTLEVDKSVFVSGALNVTGAITSKGVTTTGAFRSDGSLLVSGALNVTGTTTLASDLIVNESAFISGALNVTGTITATHGYFTELDVTNINSVTVTETTLEVVDKLILVASGTTSANAAGGGMQIGGTSSGPPGDEARFVWGHAESAMSLNKALNVTGNVHTSGSAQIYGGLLLSGALNVTGAASLAADVIIGESAFVSGALNVTGAVTAKAVNSTGSILSDGSLLLSGALNVTGAASMAADVIIGESLFISGALNVTGAATATALISTTAMSGAGGISGQSLTVQQNVTGAAAVQAQTLAIQAGMTITGSSVHHGAFSVTNKISGSGFTSNETGINVSKNADISGTLLVQKAGFISGALNVSGNVTSNGLVINTAAAASTIAGIQADSLTSGKAFNITSNSDDTSSRTLMQITNDASEAVGTRALYVVNDAIASSIGQTVLIETTAADTNPLLELRTSNVATDKPPILAFHRTDSDTEADDMSLGTVTFRGKDSGDAETDYVKIEAIASDITNNDEGGKLTIKALAGGTAGTAGLKNLLSVGGEDVANSTACEVVVNDDSVDCDFRVESDGNPNMLFVDAGNDKVGIGTESPARKFHVSGSISDASLLVESDSKVIELLPGNGPSIRFGTTVADTDYYMSVGAFGGYNQISLQHGYTDFQISGTMGGIGYYFDQPGGNVGIGTQFPSASLHVSSSGDGALLQVDGDTQSGSASPSPAALLVVTGSGPGSAQNTAALSGGVGIGTSTPTQVLEVFPDKDVAAIIGRAFVGYNGFNSDAATFGHRDLQGSAYALYQSAAGLTILNGASGQDMYFRINNSTKATLDSNGQFGIGTASPQSLLHVSSSTESLAGEKLFEVDGKALGSVLFATGSGRVGIRTNTPTAPLSVVGTISSSAGLMIAGPASFSGDLELSGAAFVSGALNVTGAATVTSLISLTAMSGAGGASAQTLTTDGQISGSAGLSVVGGIVGDSNIDMSGTLLVQKAGFVSGALNVSGALTSKGILLADGGAAATPASGYGAIYVTSDVLYFKTDGGSATNLLAGGGGGGAVANYNNNGNNRILTSVDSDTINGEANLLFDGSTLSSSVGGIFVGGLIISNNIDMTGTLLVQKAAFVSGALNVSGAATATSLLSLTAMSGAGGLSAQTLTTDGQISGAAGLSVVGGIVCDSSIDLTGTLLVQKAAFVSGALNVSGTITADSFSISTAMSGAGGLSAQSLTVQQNVTGSAAVQAQTLAIQAGMTVTGSSLVHGTFNAQKAQSAAVTATSVDIDVGDNHFFIIFEGTSAATASLPAVSGKTGRMYHFANMSNNDSHLVIDGDNDELVNHGLGYTMTHGGATVGLICDGAQWVLFTAYEAQEE